MFTIRKFWEKNPQSENVDVAVESREVSEVSVDLMIHQEVYSTQELLLAEAKRIINAPPVYDVEKYNRLMKLHSMGFTGVDQVKELKAIDDELKYQKQLQTTIQYYQQKYPFNRFITKDAVKNVCEKYGLFLTEIANYISDIPEKNQKELVKFLVRHGDTRCPYEVLQWDEYKTHEYEYEANEQRKKYHPNYTEEMICGRTLLIIAPKEKLNLKDKKIEGHVVKQIIKDPIVLQSVNCRGWEYGIPKTADGYLIVTSWGLEAADEAIVNSINN